MMSWMGLEIPQEIIKDRSEMPSSLHSPEKLVVRDEKRPASEPQE